MAELADEKTQELELKAVIGFNGKVPEGLILHPDDKHIIYPLGSTIVVKHLLKNKQYFLHKGGHDQPVSCLALSKSGKFLASGEETHMGFPAVVCIWDLETREVVHRLRLLKGKVASLSFSPNEQFLATLGGQDDNRVIVWDVETGNALTGKPATNQTETATLVRYLNTREDIFITAGEYSLRVWEFDMVQKKIRVSNVNLGQIKRVISCMTVAEDDSALFCGTQTGDLLHVSLKTRVLKTMGPRKRPFPQGITAVEKTLKGHLIVGTGEGIVALLHKTTMKTIRKKCVFGKITSFALNAAGDHFFVGTSTCDIHLMQLATFDSEIRTTCHFDRINDVAFPFGFSDLFATCSTNDIRVWNSKSNSELLRIQVPNLDCLCVCFPRDGKSIASGWSDGKIRAFKPQSGQLLYVINDAHHDGVTALTFCSDSKTLISGGNDAQVRVWAIGKRTHKMVASMKEHKAVVNSIVVSEDDKECVSAAADGSCIAWSLERFTRNTSLFASTQFRAVEYHPDGSQFLTTGTDRKITYWDAADGQPIRILEGSPTGFLTTLSIPEDGTCFVSGGADKMVRVWSYDEGSCYFSGVGHSGCITRVRVSPDQKFVVSVGEEGAIFMWAMPDTGVFVVESDE